MDLGEQAHSFEGQVFIPEMVVCHDRVATGFVNTIDGHVVIPPLMSPAGIAALTVSPGNRGIPRIHRFDISNRDDGNSMTGIPGRYHRIRCHSGCGRVPPS